MVLKAYITEQCINIDLYVHDIELHWYPHDHQKHKCKFGHH